MSLKKHSTVSLEKHSRVSRDFIIQTRNFKKPMTAQIRVSSGKQQILSYRYSELPYGCIEDSNCPMRFSTRDMQIKHHVNSHGSKLPYYCLSCMERDIIIQFRTKDELLKHDLKTAHKFKFNQRCKQKTIDENEEQYL